MLSRDMSGSGEVLDMTKAGIAARKRKIHEMGARLREDALLGETAAERRAYIRSTIRGPPGGPVVRTAGAAGASCAGARTGGRSARRSVGTRGIACAPTAWP